MPFAEPPRIRYRFRLKNVSEIAMSASAGRRCVSPFFCLLAIGCAVPTTSSSARAAGFTLTAEEQSVVDITNLERKKQNLPPLNLSPLLFQAARLHTANMVKQGKMEHVLDGKGPSDRVRAAGYQFALVGENVAEGQQSPDSVLDAWMNSPGHRANILKDGFTEIGVGVVRDSQGRPYWTQVFGRPLRNPSGAVPVTVKVTVVNAAEKNASFQFSGSASSKILKAGAKFDYTVTESGRLPSIKVRNGKAVSETPLQDGGVYEIRQDGSGEWKIESTMRSKT